MKKAKILMAAGIFFLAGMMFTACGNEGTSEENQEQSAENAVYQCPMDCEDGKTYDEPGSCPLCKMDLEEVES